MKKFLMLASVVIFTTMAATAQKYVVIDSRYIFDKLAEYKEVQKSIEGIAAGWQKEVDAKQANLDKLYQDYDAQQDMMTAEAKKKKEAELYAKEKELRDLQKKYFGFEGSLFKKRMELMQPLQDKLAKAVKNLVQTNGYDMVFDKSEGKSIIFADQKLDKSDEVLKMLR